MDLEAHRLAGQRMIEVEQQPLCAHLPYQARIAALAVGGRELHHIAHVVLFIRIAELVHQGQLHTLQQLGIALAKSLARRQLKARVNALTEADQPRLDGRRQLTRAQRQGRRLVVKGIDQIAAIGGAEPVMQGQERTSLDEIHDFSLFDRLPGF